MVGIVNYADGRNDGISDKPPWGGVSPTTVRNSRAGVCLVVYNMELCKNAKFRPPVLRNKKSWPFKITDTKIEPFSFFSHPYSVFDALHY